MQAKNRYNLLYKEKRLPTPINHRYSLLSMPTDAVGAPLVGARVDQPAMIRRYALLVVASRRL
jgi:hypothetical protein